MDLEKKTQDIGSEVKIFVVSGSILSIVGFFLPWVDSFIKISPLVAIKELYGKEPSVLFLSIPLVIGMIAIVVTIIKANPKIYGFLSLATLMYVVFQLLSGSSKLGIKVKDIGDVVELMTKVVGVGMYLTLSGLIILSAFGLFCKVKHEN